MSSTCYVLISDVVRAVLRVGDTLVGHTDWRKPSPHCWDQMHYIHINRVQILRVSIGETELSFVELQKENMFYRMKVAMN